VCARHICLMCVVVAAGGGVCVRARHICLMCIMCGGGGGHVCVGGVHVCVCVCAMLDACMYHICLICVCVCGGGGGRVGVCHA